MSRHGNDVENKKRAARISQPMRLCISKQILKFILMNKYSTFSRLRQAAEKYKNTKILK